MKIFTIKNNSCYQGMKDVKILFVSFPLRRREIVFTVMRKDTKNAKGPIDVMEYYYTNANS